MGIMALVEKRVMRYRSFFAKRMSYVFATRERKRNGKVSEIKKKHKSLPRENPGKEKELFSQELEGHLSAGLSGVDGSLMYRSRKFCNAAASKSGAGICIGCSNRISSGQYRAWHIRVDSAQVPKGGE